MRHDKVVSPEDGGMRRYVAGQLRSQIPSPSPQIRLHSLESLVPRLPIDSTIVSVRRWAHDWSTFTTK